MSQKLTKGLLTAGIIFLHALTAWMTGRDTYSVAGDFLSVALIDATFVIAALAAAYLGGSVESLFIRPVAAVLAWVLYIQMVVIGFEAHADQPEVALAVRTAGFGLLVLDTWVYIVAAGRKLRTAGSQARDWRASLRGGVASIAYVFASVLLAPIVSLMMLVRACADYLRDTRGASDMQYSGSRGRVTISGLHAMPDKERLNKIIQSAVQTGIMDTATKLTNTPPPATYQQADDGSWSFVCPICGPEHEGARIKPYETEEAAHRGYAAHQAIHKRQSLSTPPAPVMVGSDQ